MNGVGRTVTVPRPQFSVTSPRTSAVTSATAGLASRMASCTLRADVATGVRSVRAASPRTRAAFIARDRITGAGHHTKRRPPSTMPACRLRAARLRTSRSRSRGRPTPTAAISPTGSGRWPMAAPTPPVPLAAAARRVEGAVATSGGVTAASMRRMDGRAHMSELATEPGRIERLASIREVVFGAQDGLVSTFAVIAGLAAAGVGPLVVVLGGAVSAMAGVLSMSIGTFLSSRAQRQLYERELDRERREIRDHAGEEIAELIAALASRGMTLAALFCVGVLKARVAGVSALRSGLEVAVLAAASGLISFGLGRLASVVLGVDLRG